MIKDGLWDIFNGYHMGNTAENVAQRWQITREQQDQFALRSQKQGRSGAEGRPLQGRDRAGEDRRAQRRCAWSRPTIIRKHGATMEAMARLRPAFDKDGTVTAGNASGINDGAAVRGADERRGCAAPGHQADGAHRLLGHRRRRSRGDGPGPIPASRMALKQAGWKAEDLDLIEANEAFAAQACAVNKDMGWDPAKVNVNGGAIASAIPSAPRARACW